jgi:hypothetical protein
MRHACGERNKAPHQLGACQQYLADAVPGQNCRRIKNELDGLVRSNDAQFRATDAIVLRISSYIKEPNIAEICAAHPIVYSIVYLHGRKAGPDQGRPSLDGETYGFHDTRI